MSQFRNMRIRKPHRRLTVYVNAAEFLVLQAHCQETGRIHHQRPNVAGLIVEWLGPKLALMHATPRQRWDRNAVLYPDRDPPTADIHLPLKASARDDLRYYAAINNASVTRVVYTWIKPRIDELVASKAA